MGLPSNFNQGARTPQDFRETKWQPWIQDDWRVTKRLTLNLGLRWEPWLPPIDKLGPATGFIPGVQSQMAPFAPKGLLFSGDGGDCATPSIPPTGTTSPRAWASPGT